MNDNSGHIDFIESGSARHIESPSERPVRVLAVDDQHDSLRLLQLRLKAGGFQCETAASGREALDCLDAQPADAIILDVMMPDMSGHEICRRLKSNDRTKDIPIIFLTAQAESEHKVEGFEAGGHDYLVKPVEQAELIARTRAAVRVKRLQDQLKNQIRLQDEINQLQQKHLNQHFETTLGQLSASLAHEINNPLTAALGTAQLLSAENLSEAGTQERIKVLQRSLERASRKLRSLLLIAQNAGPIQTIDLSEITEDLLTLISFRVMIQKISISQQVQPDCFWRGVACDLARGLFYILNNAVDAVEGIPNATINLSVDSTSSHHRVRIADNGPGIEPSLQDSIFEPFFTTKNPPHSGLGLHQAVRIIESLGGTIDLKSSPNQCLTEFVVSLPIAADRE